MLHRVSLVRRRRPTRVAGPGDARLPLHSSPIPCLDLGSVMRAMQPKARIRLRELLLLLATPGFRSCPPSSFAPADAQRLVTDGVATVVTADILRERPTTGGCVPFCVVEEKPEGARRRFILWPKSQNRAVYDKGFRSEVPLEHVSAYLGAATATCGATCDLKVGFFQVGLDENVRANFRFVDSDGTMYEMTRLPMGHCVSVDVMQLITETIVGAHRTAAPQQQCPLDSSVWVDGGLLVGVEAAVIEAANWVSRSAARFGATFKAPLVPASTAEFIGVNFDFAAHTVRVAKKTLGKLPQRIPDKLPAGDLEQLVGRLIFAAAVSGTPLGSYFFALKTTRRVFNHLNRGKLETSSVVSLDRTSRHQLQQLLERCTATRKIANDHATGAWRLYSDASVDGWGAVLLAPNGQVFSCGGKWAAIKSSKEIAQLEATAVIRALASFQDKLRGAARLQLVVDNTSVQHGVKRGNARAPDLAPLVANIVDVVSTLGCPTTVAYVKSQDNPADIPSRTFGPLPKTIITDMARTAPIAEEFRLRCSWGTGEKGILARGERAGKAGIHSLSSVCLLK